MEPRLALIYPDEHHFIERANASLGTRQYSSFSTAILADGVLSIRPSASTRHSTYAKLRSRRRTSARSLLGLQR